MSERRSKLVKAILHDLTSGNYDLNKNYNGGNTILHILSLADSFDMLSGLDTPLQLACREKHIEIIQLLLEAGADPAIENTKGGNALDAAILASSPQVCMLLMYHHPGIVNRLRGTKQVSIWHYITSEKAPLQMVHWFCKLVNTIIVPIDQPLADNKRTALSFCIEYGRQDCALELLQAGAQLSAAMHGLQSVPEWAIQMALAVKDQQIQRLRDQVDFVVGQTKKRRVDE